MLPGLAKYLFKEHLREPDGSVRFITSNVNWLGEIWKSYLRLERPGKEPEMFSSGQETQTTHEEALEVLKMALINKIATRDKEKIREMQWGKERFMNAMKEEKYANPYL